MVSLVVSCGGNDMSVYMVVANHLCCIHNPSILFSCTEQALSVIRCEVYRVLLQYLQSAQQPNLPSSIRPVEETMTWRGPPQVLQAVHLASSAVPDKDRRRGADELPDPKSNHVAVAKVRRPFWEVL